MAQWALNGSQGAPLRGISKAELHCRVFLLCRGGLSCLLRARIRLPWLLCLTGLERDEDVERRPVHDSEQRTQKAQMPNW